jgi:hypothetical protein
MAAHLVLGPRAGRAGRLELGRGVEATVRFAACVLLYYLRRTFMADNLEDAVHQLFG